MVTRRVRIAACVLGAILIALGAVVQWSESIVRDRLLDAEFYGDTFVEEGVYHRVYTEVLVDPAVRDVTERLLGGLNIEGSQIRNPAGLTNAVLRLALPPATLRAATERGIDRILAYIRGDIDRIDATVDLSQALSTVDVTVDALLGRLLARVPRQVTGNLAEYELAVRDFVRELEAGRVPTWLPIVGGSAVSQAQVIAAIEGASRFGLPSDVVDRVVLALSSGDEAAALIAAASTFVSTHLETVADDPTLSSRLEIDVVDALGRQAGQPQREVIKRLNELRSWVRLLPGWAGPAALVAIAIGALLVTWAARRPVVILLTYAASTAAAALVIGTIPGVVARAFTSPLERASTGGRGNSLPPSIVRVLGDVEDAIGHALGNSAEGRASLLLWISLACLVVPTVLATAAAAKATEPAVVWAVSGAGVLAAGMAAVWVPAPTAHVAERRCNGHAALCERRYDEVVQAATHNSMSSPDIVRIWPEHDADISAQLNFGIRTLLIDTHYWEAIESPGDLSTAEQTLPPEAARYLFAELQERLGARPGTYLCHVRCAYGAVSFEAALVDIKTFLEANTTDIVTLIIQDAITVADTEAAFRATGLEEFLYAGDPSDEWPTLGEMIDANQRLVVFSEANGPPPAWYHSAFEVIGDTSFTVQSRDAFTCDIGRGPSEPRLFLMNHWVARPVPDRADAAVVNARNFIIDRAEECAEQLDRFPNFIAVNFFSLGDVIGAVDELNRRIVTASESG